MAFSKQETSEPLASVIADPIVASEPRSTGKLTMAEVSNRAPLMRIESSQISPFCACAAHVNTNMGKERKQELTKRKDSMERQEEDKKSSPPNLPGCSGKCCIWSRKVPAQQSSTSARSSEPKMSVTAQLELTGRDRIVVLETKRAGYIHAALHH
jgi:hypothetical protein